MTARPHRALQPKTVKTRVSACEGLCALLWGGWHLYTFEKLKRGVGAFVRRCRGERFYR